MAVRYLQCGWYDWGTEFLMLLFKFEHYIWLASTLLDSIALDQDLTNFSVEDQMVNILGFVDHMVPVATI